MMMIQIVLTRNNYRVYYDFLPRSFIVLHVKYVNEVMIQTYSLDQMKSFINDSNFCLKDYIKCFYKKD